MRSAVLRGCVLLFCLVAISACNGVAPTPAVGRTAAAAAYLAAATAYNDAMNATRKKYPGELTQPQNRSFGTELADNIRSSSDALRAIEFPADVAGDVKFLLQRDSDLEVLYRIAAAATTVSDSNSAWDKVAQAELAVSQAANTVRADLGLPSVPISTPVPTAISSSTADRAGLVTFGTAYDHTTLYITKPTTRFKTTYRKICFSALLTEAAGASALKMVMGRVSPGGSETQVWSTSVAISNPKADQLADCPDLALAADQRAGTYAVRFLRGGTVLSEGTFTLVK